MNETKASGDEAITAVGRIKATDDATTARILTRPAVREMIGIGQTKFQQVLNDPDQGFPRPIWIHARKQGWFADEVIAWLRNRPRVAASGRNPRPLSPQLQQRVEGKRLASASKNRALAAPAHAA